MSHSNKKASVRPMKQTFLSAFSIASILLNSLVKKHKGMILNVIICYFCDIALNTMDDIILYFSTSVKRFILNTCTIYTTMKV